MNPTVPYLASMKVVHFLSDPVYQHQYSSACWKISTLSGITFPLMFGL